MIDKTPPKGDEKPEACSEGSERNSRVADPGASKKITAMREKPSPEEMQLMERVVARENMKKALRRVEGNKGAKGGG
jgi:hypothetical protein